jgi:hypothetical protein
VGAAGIELTTLACEGAAVVNTTERDPGRPMVERSGSLSLSPPRYPSAPVSGQETDKPEEELDLPRARQVGFKPRPYTWEEAA